MSIAEKAKNAIAGNKEQLENALQELPSLPAGMMQTKTGYVTAVQVIRPRVLPEVERRVLEEASIAGDDFYYSWQQGGETIEGLSVGAALAMVRNFGNCAVDVKVEEQPFSYIFSATFIDLETGFNLTRTFRQNKQSPKSKSGKDIYKGERGIDIVFQIGQSKAIRNVVLNAVPNWLSKKVIMKSKDKIINQIKEMGIPKASQKIIDKAKKLGIPIENIQAIFGKTWDVEHIVQISSALRAIEDGVENASDRFPDVAHPEQQPEPPNTDSGNKENPTIEDTPPVNPIIAASNKIKEAYYTDIRKTKTEKQKTFITQNIDRDFSSGNLTEEDYNDLKKLLSLLQTK